MKRTMTVAELIEALQDHDETAPVVFGGLTRIEALYACQNASDANSVCVIMSAGAISDEDGTRLAAMGEGEYAEAVGAA